MLEGGVHEQDDAIEEEAPDWRLLSKLTKGLGSQAHAPNVEPFIPRRGEKDFEPIEALAPVQLKALLESRQALFAALSVGIRGHSSRDHVRCIWTNPRSKQSPQDECQLKSRLPPYIDGVAKGVLFSSIGRWNRESKRLELTPEELLYLIERGTVECWSTADQSDAYGSVPMSVQRAWAEIIGTDQLSLERYQVYAYLKRLGYIVLRKEHVDLIWRLQVREATKPTVRSLRFFIGSLFSFLCQPFVIFNRWLGQFHIPASKLSIKEHLDKLVAANRCVISDKVWNNYESVFNALRLVTSGSKISLPKGLAQPALPRNKGYEIFYYVYKPNNRFPKSAPPPPDFQVCVVNSETMVIPNISITNNLFDTIKGPAEPIYPKNSTTKSGMDTSFIRSNNQPYTSTSFLSFAFFWNPAKSKKISPRKNVFTKIKRGDRNALLAVVDHGIISFLKFLETDFGDSPLVGSQSSI